MTDLDLMPPALPGERPPEHQKKQGFFSKLFGGSDSTTEAPKPEFADVDIEEIKRKLGLHEDQQAQMPDPEAFLPPKPDAMKDVPRQPAIPPAPVPVEEPIEREEEAPTARIEISDWTAEPPAGAPEEEPHKSESPKSETPRKKDAQPAVEHSPWEKPHEPAAQPAPGDSPWIEHPDAQADETVSGETPKHHELIEQHLAAIDTAHEKIMASIAKTADSAKAHATSADVQEWHLQRKELHPSQYFILRNGQPVKSIKELLEVLEYIDDSTFDHHVNEYRNDFAHWIEEAVGDADLAAQVRSATDRTSVLTTLRAHADGKAKAIATQARKAQSAVRKTESAISQLKNTEADIDKLRKQLETRTAELMGERKRSAKLIKGALDKELERRLKHERDALKTAISQLERGRDLYHKKMDDAQARISTLEERERKNAALETKLKDTQARLAEARKAIAEEKQELTQLKKEAAVIRKEYVDAKAHREEAQAHLKEVAQREAALARQEETLRQREEKISADIAHAQAEREALEKLKAEHLPREAEIKRKEEAARKMTDEAKQRAKDALESERASVARIRDETKKLERVRGQIDKALAKILKSKQKISSAVELRKHLEQSILGAKSALSAERKALDEGGYQALVASAVAQTPAGQPASDQTEDLERIREADFTQRITQARTALERRDLETARKIYEELRGAYAQVHEESPARSALYIAIRELYDDIHLAMLG